jgi:hypothetical protein
VRFHIKRVVFAVLRSVSDPRLEEWTVLDEVTRGSSAQLAAEAWQATHASGAWFDLLDEQAVLQAGLASADEARVDAVFTALYHARQIRPDRVAELLEPYGGTSEAWRRRFLWLMSAPEQASSRRLFDLFLRLVRDGTLDDGGAVHSEFWFLADNVAAARPDWACEAVGAYLDRTWELCAAAGNADPFGSEIPGDSLHERELFARCARAAPVAWLTHVLPFMQRVMAATAVRDGPPPWDDRVWRWRVFDAHGVKHVLLEATAVALEESARADPAGYTQLAAVLEQTEMETLLFLAARGYAAGGAACADAAVTFLLGGDARFELGYTDSARWVTRRLIEAATPHCSEGLLARLEAAIHAYRPASERGRGHRWGLGQLILLEGIPEERRSPTVRRRLAELRRKFPHYAVPEPRETEAELIGPPIPEQAAARMTDVQWLRAMARHSVERDFDERGGRLVGGAPELASLLEGEARAAPVRFAP